MAERMDSRTDADLLHAVKVGDGPALIELYRRYAGLSLTLARGYGLPEPVQAVEDGFLLLFHSASGFARCSLPAPVWILGVMQRHYRTLSPFAPSPPR